MKTHHWPFKMSASILLVFVTSRLDHCNSLLSERPQNAVKRLQLVQNAAARVLIKEREIVWGEGSLGLPANAATLRDPTPDKRKKTDGWMDGDHISHGILRNVCKM